MLPVKVIRDDKGRPFLYRYHIFALTDDGPGIAIHHFIKSDPDRGYHDHPWYHSMSFILCGGYFERIITKEDHDKGNNSYNTYNRTRWSFNYINGEKVFHRVMLEGPYEDAWTIFFFCRRDKTWGIVSLDGNYKPMSTHVSDNDGGWWNKVTKGLGLHQRLEHKDKVIATVDCVVTFEEKVLLIKRGKEPYKDCWAFPGGRIEYKDNNILEAARRELYEETNLKDIDLRYFDVVGDNKRDSRGFGLSVIYTAKLDDLPTDIKSGDDAIDYGWFNIEHIPKMAFDHRHILDRIHASHNWMPMEPSIDGDKLCDAVRKTDICKVIELLESGCSPNSLRHDTCDDDEQPDRPLKMVVFRLSDCLLSKKEEELLTRIANVLLKYGADPVPAMRFAEYRYGPYSESTDGWEALRIIFNTV